MALATAPSWSLAGFVHVPGGGSICHGLVLAMEHTVGRRSAHHRPQHQ
jgi:hypothetical protein